MNNRIKLAEEIVKSHESALKAGAKLPQKAELGTNDNTVRIHSDRINGCCWQYSINQNSVNAEIHFEAQAVSKYDAFAAEYEDSTLDFGDGLTGNTRDENKVTRKLTMKIPLGASELESSYPNIAKQAVELFARMYTRLSTKFG